MCPRNAHPFSSFTAACGVGEIVPALFSELVATCNEAADWFSVEIASWTTLLSLTSGFLARALATSEIFVLESATLAAAVAVYVALKPGRETFTCPLAGMTSALNHEENRKSSARIVIATSRRRLN